MNIYDNCTLEDLYLLVKKSDEAAFQKLYDKTWASLYEHATKKLNDEPLCKEIIQDIYIDLWNKRGEKMIHEMDNYLHQAVRFKVIDYYRKQKNIMEELDESANIFDRTHFADHKILEQELESLLHQCLDKLPNKRREIFMLRFFDGLSTKEISELINVSQKTVQNQLINSNTQLLHLLKKIFFAIILNLFGRL